MTTLTLHLSRSLAKTWKPGDEVVVTRLDHDANVTPWVLAAQDAGAVVRYVDIHPEDCTLDFESFRAQLSSRTKLVAIGCASNAAGTINEVVEMVRLARDAGALTFLDAVHFAPHASIDVQAWNCDFLACSSYKFFGPHQGILWGRRPLLESLPAYKLRPAPGEIPGRWMTGTQNHECLAGVKAAVEYLASLAPVSTDGQPLAEALQASMARIRDYEVSLARRMLDGLASIGRFKVWGIADSRRVRERVPTFAVTLPGTRSERLARFLADREVFSWHGNLYAVHLTQRLGLEVQGGFLRLGLVHYNTEAEVDRVLQMLAEYQTT